MTCPNERWIFPGVMAVSFSVILLQIALTRIFSFTIWYHFAYVTVSVALLGYAASGAFLAAFQRLGQPKVLGRYAALASALTLLALVSASLLPFHPFALREQPGKQLPLMVAFYLLTALPFFFAGLTIALSLKALPHRISRLYGFDLLGAGLGCVAAVPAIWILGTPGAVVLAAAALSLAAVLFSAGSATLRPGRAIALFLLVLLAGTTLALTLRFSPSPKKFFSMILTDKAHFVTGKTRWTPIYRTDTARFVDEELGRRYSYAGWGVSASFKETATVPGPKIRFIAHDGGACAVIYNLTDNQAELAMLDHHILKTPYLLGPRKQVLAIGIGGGVDILNAVKNGAAHVTGVELDPVTVDIVRNQEADFAGHLYDRKDVTIVAGEGRSYLRHKNAKYDLIQMTGVDTLSALATGAYVLSESYLYTVEAVGEFLDHLNPGGLLSIVGADYDEEHGYPRHSMRQISLFAAALAERGRSDPAPHIAVLASTEPVCQVVCLLKAEPLLPSEVDRLAAFARDNGFEIWALPGRKLGTLHSRFLRMTPAERHRFLATAPLRLDPTTDDSPFYFNYYRWLDLGKHLREVDVGHTLATAQLVLVLILVLSVVLSVVFVLLPISRLRRKSGHLTGYLFYFGGIGLGFILIEISLIQRLVLFLGYPTYSLSVVLFSLLTFTGIGSLASGYVARLRTLLVVFLATAVTEFLLLDSLLRALLGFPLAFRILAAVLIIAPLAFLMGMFFPKGMNIVRRTDTSLIPWAFAVNGCASVIGSILAVILAISAGFRIVSGLALLAYVVGYLGIAAAPLPSHEPKQG